MGLMRARRRRIDERCIISMRAAFKVDIYVEALPLFPLDYNENAKGCAALLIPGCY
jgi:hypothetical protein